MTQRLLLLVLLAVMPFNGLRVLCPTVPASPRGSLVAEEEDADCSRICAVHRDDREPGETCLLTSGPDSQTVLDLPVMQHALLAAGPAARVSAVDVVDFYRSPGLSRANPPPKFRTTAPTRL